MERQSSKVTTLEAKVNWLQERLTLCEKKLELPELTLEEFLHNGILNRIREEEEAIG